MKILQPGNGKYMFEISAEDELARQKLLFAHNWLEGQYEKMVKALLHFQHVESKQLLARRIIETLKGEIRI
jgi:hypothetical protein